MLYIMVRMSTYNPPQRDVVSRLRSATLAWVFDGAYAAARSLAADKIADMCAASPINR